MGWGGVGWVGAWVVVVGWGGWVVVRVCAWGWVVVVCVCVGCVCGGWVGGWVGGGGGGTSRALVSQACQVGKCTWVNACGPASNAGAVRRLIT